MITVTNIEIFSDHLVYYENVDVIVVVTVVGIVTVVGVVSVVGVVAVVSFRQKGSCSVYPKSQLIISQIIHLVE